MKKKQMKNVWGVVGNSSLCALIENLTRARGKFVLERRRLNVSFRSVQNRARACYALARAVTLTCENGDRRGFSLIKCTTEGSAATDAKSNRRKIVRPACLLFAKRAIKRIPLLRRAGKSSFAKPISVFNRIHRRGTPTDRISRCASAIPHHHTHARTK